MSLREKMNQNPQLVMGIVGGIVVLSLVWIVYYMWPSGGPEVGGPIGGGKMYYTKDDGRTFFDAPVEKVTEPDAIVAWVYRYPGEQPFVGMLESYTPRGREWLKKFYADPKNKDQLPPDNDALLAERLIKRPAMPNWVNQLRDPQSARTILTMPQKNGNVPTRILPDTPQ